MPFGIEIEAKGINIRQVHGILNAAGIDCVAYGDYHPDGYSRWYVTTDGSVDGGFELVSPKLYGTAGLQEVERVYDLLRENGAYVDRQCGLHVHHSAEGLTRRSQPSRYGTSNSTPLRKVAQLYYQYYPVFQDIFPPSRQRNNYCQVDDPSRYLRPGYSGHNGRYHAVNLEAVSRHGTVEFRQHAGTLNGKKATSWIVFTQRFMEYVRQGGTFSRRGGRGSATPRTHTYDDPVAPTAAEVAELARGLKTMLGLYRASWPEGQTMNETTARAYWFMSGRAELKWQALIKKFGYDFSPRRTRVRTQTIDPAADQPVEPFTATLGERLSFFSNLSTENVATVVRDCTCPICIAARQPHVMHRVIELVG